MQILQLHRSHSRQLDLQYVPHVGLINYIGITDFDYLGSSTNGVKYLEVAKYSLSVKNGYIKGNSVSHFYSAGNNPVLNSKNHATQVDDSIKFSIFGSNVSPKLASELKHSKRF